MSKVTTKLQVTIPKAIADRFGIEPGDEIEWVVTGDGIRVVPTEVKGPVRDLAWKLAMFDASVARQEERNKAWTGPVNPSDRGWTREDAYRRGRAD